MAINHFMEFYSTRLNYIHVMAGQETTVHIEPVWHTATESFKKLDVASRQCLLPHESVV